MTVSLKHFFYKSNHQSNVCIGCMILLLVFLSETKLLQPLFHTYFGRFLIFLLIVGFSSLQPILGIITVVILVIAFYTSARSDPLYFEGMTTSGSATATESATKDTKDTKASADSTTAKASSSDSTTAKASTDSTTVKAVADKKSTTDANANANTSISDSIGNIKNKIMDSMPGKSSDAASKEGFDLIGTESQLKKGKQSNSVTVLPQSKHSENILPFDEIGTFTAF